MVPSILVPLKSKNPWSSYGTQMRRSLDMVNAKSNLLLDRKEWLQSLASNVDAFSHSTKQKDTFLPNSISLEQMKQSKQVTLKSEE